MSYLLRDNSRHKRGGLGKEISKVLLVCLVLVIIYFMFGKGLATILHSTQKGIGYVLGYYDESVRPLSENSLIQSLKTENEQLRELLDRHPETDSRILGVVIARPPKVPYDALLIDIGLDHELETGDEVYAEMDYSIGTIDQVFPKSAVIRLHSAPGEKIDVLIGTSTIPVVAEGRGGGNFYIKVPKNIMISEGDSITASFNGRPVIVGTAEKVESSDGEAFSYVYFRLPVKLNALHYVQIKKILR